MREESEDAEPIVHRNDDNAFFGEVGAVLARLRGSAADESSAVYPDHDGKLVFGFAFAELGRRPDVKVEAVFADARIAEDHIVEDAALHAARSELGGFASVLPFRWLGGRLPAEIADRRLCERDAEENGDGAVGFAFELAGVNFYCGSGTGSANANGGEQSDKAGGTNCG